MATTAPCIVCGNVTYSSGFGGDSFNYHCVRCGQFSLSGTANSLIDVRIAKDDPRRIRLSHQLRLRHDPTRWVNLSWELVQRLAEIPLPTPGKQAVNLLLWLGSTADLEAAVVRPTLELEALVGAPRQSALFYVLQHLRNRELVQFDFVEDKVHVAMQFSGWGEYERLKIESPQSTTAFMAMKFGDGELDWMVENVFKPAVQATGFSLQLLSDVPRAGLIDDRLRVEIRQSRFLLADVTHGNLGAYWEAGFAEGVGKPVIYMCRKHEFKNGASHFDTNHHLTVMWDREDLEATAESLKATIRATFPLVARLSDPAAP